MRIRKSVIMASLACGLASAAVTPKDAARILDAASLRFEPAPNGPAGAYVARGLRSSFLFHGSEVLYRAGSSQVRLHFEGAAGNVQLNGADKLHATSNILHGKDRSKWRSKVSNYSRLEASGLYPGIDLVYYGTAGELEYDLVVKPGADPNQIRFRITGEDAELDKHGNLIAGLIQKRPVAYQFAPDGSKVSVESKYSRNYDDSFGFSLGDYDRARELVIDPVVSFSTYLDGTAQDVAVSIGHDAAGFLYVGGTTSSYDFPATGDAFQPARNLLRDVFVAKIDPNAPAGKQVLYATYLGGSGTEQLNGMVVTARGQVYLTGSTDSIDFPVANAGQATNGGGLDAFIVWLDPALGANGLLYSSYLGGTGDEIGNDLALDSRSRIFITGSTTSTTDSASFTIKSGFQNTYGGSTDAFVAGFDPSLVNAASLVYSTYLGGTGWDTGRSIAAGPGGTFWVAGGTYSYDFPVIGYSYQPYYKSGGDGFVAQINPASGANSMVYATYVGGSDQDEAFKVLVEPTGRVVVMGYTLSTDMPVSANAMQRQNGGDTDVFVLVLNTVNPQADRNTQLIYGTYYGGNDGDFAYDLKRDSAGKYYLTGYSYSHDLPLSVNALQPTHSDGLDAFVLKFDPAVGGAAAINYATLLGSTGLQSGTGIDLNETTGTIYVTGYATGSIFDKVGGVQRTTDPGKPNAFVVGIKP
jgi:hypothetical protein